MAWRPLTAARCAFSSKRFLSGAAAPATAVLLVSSAKRCRIRYSCGRATAGEFTDLMGGEGMYTMLNMLLRMYIKQLCLDEDTFPSFLRI